MENITDIQDVQSQELTQQDPPSKKLWKGLVSNGKYTKSFDDFSKQYSTPESISKLYKGLIEDGDYTKSINDFQSQYFSDLKKKETTIPSTNGLQTSSKTTPSVLETPSISEKEIPQVSLGGELKGENTTYDNMSEDDYNKSSVFDKIKMLDELKNQGTWVGGGNTGGGGGSFSMSADASLKANKIAKDIQDSKIDVDKLKDYTEGLNLNDEQKNQFDQLLKTNPSDAYRTLANNQWKLPVRDALKTKIDEANLNGDRQLANNLIDKLNFTYDYSKAGSYNDVRNNIRSLVPIIRDNTDNPDKLVGRLGEEASIAYGSELVHNPGAVQTDETKAAGLNDYQVAALNYFQDLNPSKYEAYRGVLLKSNDPTLSMTPEEKTKFLLLNKGIHNDSYTKTKVGEQVRLKQLEETGISLKYDALNEMYADALSRNDVEKANSIKQQIDGLKEESRNIDLKYPLLKELNSKLATDEVLGNDSNPIARFFNKVNESVSNTVEGVGNMGSSLNPFENDQEKYQRLSKVLGNKKMQEVETNLPQSSQLMQSKELVYDDKDFGKAIEDIKNSKLSDSDKRIKTEKLFADNVDKWHFKGIDPKSNLSVKSLLFAFTDFGAEIAPYVLVSSMVGGGASSGALQKFVGEFAGGMTTMYNDELSNAIERGEPNPQMSAWRSTTINALSLAGAGTTSEIRALASKSKNPLVRNMISNLDDETILKALRYDKQEVSGLRKIVNVAKNLGSNTIESGKSALKVTTATTAGQKLNQYIDNGEVDLSDVPKELLVGTLKFTLFGSALGLGKAFKEPNDIQKLSIYEAGKNPDEFIRSLDSKYADGNLTKEEYIGLKKNVETAKKVYENTPQLDGNGNKLSDADARELMFLKYQEADIEKTMGSHISKDLNKKLEERLKRVQDNIDKVYKGAYIPNILLDEKTKSKDEHGNTDTYLINGENVSKEDFQKSVANKTAAEYEYNGEDENTKQSLIDLGGNYEKGVTAVSFGEKGHTISSTPKEEQPIEKANTGTEVEPNLGDGRKPVTLSGNTEEERQVAIDRRMKETKQTPMTSDRDKLLERINKYNNLPKFEKRKSTEVNNIKISVDNFNKTHDQKYSVSANRDGSLDLRNNKDRRMKYSPSGNDGSIVENSKPLIERDDNTQKVFNDLLDNDVLPISRRVNGEKMSESEHDATIQDIMDGIPSQRAENYLNSLEKQIKNDDFDYGNPDKNTRVTLKDALGITEEHGEPMSLDKVHEWLNTESELTPEDETTLDNIENLLTHYEQRHELPEGGISPKVKQPTQEGTGTISKPTEPNKPKEEVSNQANTETPTLDNNGNEVPPINKVEEVGNSSNTGGIDKKSLKNDYGFEKNFDTVSHQEVANKAVSELNESANENGITLEQQVANEIANMGKKIGDASEHDIMTAALNLRLIDEQIKKANDNGEPADHLLIQQQKALEVLRMLGNRAGRNLGLFSGIYKLVDNGKLEVTRAAIRKNLDIPFVPQTMVELKLSKLSDTDKKKVEPYVKAIERLNKALADINSRTSKEIVDFNNKEVKDYIEAEVNRRINEKGSSTPQKKYKKSQSLKDLAQRIRTQNELDKFMKGSGGEIVKSSIFGDIDFKELAAQAIEYIAKGIDKTEDVAKLIKEASLRFKGKFNYGEFNDAITKIYSKALLPDKTETIDKIKEIARNSGADNITKDMVDAGLINDVVNDYIHSDAAPENVIDLATKELKEYLPKISKSNVEDAILRRGEFKEETKQQLNNQIQEKTAEVKRLIDIGNGIRKEVAGKEEIRIAQAAQAFIEEIKNDNSLSEEVKKEHIKSVEQQRDTDLENTRQGVLLNLKDSVDNHISEITERQNKAVLDRDNDLADSLNEIKRDLQDLSDKLSPNDENLKDQIDKADQDLQAIIKSHEGSDFEKPLKDIQKEYHDNWQRTADELQHQALLKKAEQSLNESKRRLAAGQYTEIPTNLYDIGRDVILARKDAESRKAWNELNSLANKAKEQRETRGVIGKWLQARRTWLIMSFGAIEKVGLSGISKPIIDPFIIQTFGRIAGKITGIKPTGDWWSRGGFAQIFATYKNKLNEKSATQFMFDMNNKYIETIKLHKKTVEEFGADSDEAKMTKRMVDDAELNHKAALGFLFINANSLVDIAQVMTKGATDLDAAMGKYKQSSYKERTKAQEVAFWIEGVNRTHSAIKSVSQRQALLDHYRENLQYFQRKEGYISEENRQRAWDMSVLSSEVGRFGEATLLSRFIGRMKSSDKGWVRNTAQYTLPVAKISINITKQGIDMAFPMIEASSKIFISGAKHGIKLNAADRVEYNNFMSKYFNGVKRGFDSLPLEQKKYINTLISRGLFGIAQYALIGYGLSSGFVKYGGAYDPNDPFGKNRPKGSDGNPLGYGEWEFGGARCPMIVNLLINHSPYSLPASTAAVTYEQYNLKKQGTAWQLRAFAKTANEVYERLPFVTGVDLVKSAFGDQYKLQNIIANEVPTMKATAEYFDKDTEGNKRAVQLSGDGFWGTVGNIIQSKIPFWRNKMASKVGISDINSDEYKFLASKNAGIKYQQMSKLDIVNSDGKKVDITNSDYDRYMGIREQLVKGLVNDLMNGRRYFKDGELEIEDKDGNLIKVEGGKNISSEDAKNLTKSQIDSYLIKATQWADKEAIKQVWNGDKSPKTKDELEISLY